MNVQCRTEPNYEFSNCKYEIAKKNRTDSVDLLMLSSCSFDENIITISNYAFCLFLRSAFGATFSGHTTNILCTHIEKDRKRERKNGQMMKMVKTEPKNLIANMSTYHTDLNAQLYIHDDRKRIQCSALTR